MRFFVSYYSFAGGRTQTFVDPPSPLVSDSPPQSMAFSSLRSLCDANRRNDPVMFSPLPWSGTRSVSDEEIPKLYGHVDHLCNDIPLFLIDSDNVMSDLSELDAELEVSAHGHSSARNYFAQVCGFHWEAHSGRTSLPSAPVLDLTVAFSDDEYTFCWCLALSLANV